MSSSPVSWSMREPDRPAATPPASRQASSSSIAAGPHGCGTVRMAQRCDLGGPVRRRFGVQRSGDQLCSARRMETEWTGERCWRRLDGCGCAGPGARVACVDRVDMCLWRPLCRVSMWVLNATYNVLMLYPVCCVADKYSNI